MPYNEKKKCSLEYITRALGYWFHSLSHFQSFISGITGITGKPSYKSSQETKNEHLLKSPSEKKSITRNQNINHLKI